MRLIPVFLILTACWALGQSITVGDVMAAVPEVAKFNTQVPVLRLSKSNYFTVNGTKYELRFFSFFRYAKGCLFRFFDRVEGREGPTLPISHFSLIQQIP